MMSGIGLFAGLISFVIYIGMPVLAVLILMWIYRIKQNSDMQVEQNKEIIALLKLSDKS